MGTTMAEQRIIDTKLPLTWLLTTAGTMLAALISVLWNVSAQTNKLEQLIQQQTKIERRLDERDARLDRMVADLYEIKRVDDQQSLRIDALERNARQSSKKE